MRYLAAYMLAQLGGRARPDADDIKTIMGSVGIECKSERLTLLLDQLQGKHTNDLIAQGREKLCSVSTAAPSTAVAVAAPAGGAPAAAAPVKAAEKKPEPESESEDDDMGFGLFN